MSTPSEANKPSSGRIKAFILSAVIFPGLGQISQKRYLMGGLLMSISVLCLYIVVGEMLAEINLASERIIASGSMDMSRVHAEARAIVLNLDTPLFLTSAYALIATWLFAALEVFKPLLNK